MALSVVNWIIMTIAFKFVIVTSQDPPVLSSASNTWTICNVTACNIICNASVPCQNMTIDASESTTLNLTCVDPASCAYLYLMQGPSDSAYIHCVETSSCTHAVLNITSTQNQAHVECKSPSPWSHKYQCINMTLHAPNTKQINVECGSERSCSYSVFHVENADDASFNFSEYYSASHATIYANNIQHTLNISCGRSACKYVTVYGNSISSTQKNQSVALNINCIKYHACFYANIHCPIMPEASCNMQCYDSWSCQYADIIIPNYIYNLKLMCVEADEYNAACDEIDVQCLNDRLHSTNLIYTNSELHALECTDDQCCPHTVNTVCPDGEECVVDCTNSDCEYRYIDASLATSLTVQCDAPGSCQYMKIQCPDTQGSECDIHCNEADVCWSVEISASFTSVLSLNCTAVNSCGAVKVINGPMNQANIDCLHSHSCSLAQFNLQNTSVLDMACVSHNSKACYNATVDAVNADIIHLDCGSGDCDHMVLYANDTTSTNISCLEPFSCVDVEIFANDAETFDLICGGDRSCMFGNVYCQNSDLNRCSVHCLGTHSCDYMNIFVNEDNHCLELYCDRFSCYLIRLVCVPSDADNNNSVAINNTIQYCMDQSNTTNATTCCPNMDDIHYTITTTTISTSEVTPVTMLSTVLLAENKESTSETWFTKYSIVLYVSIVIMVLLLLIGAMCWMKGKNIEQKEATPPRSRKHYNAVDRDSGDMEQNAEKALDHAEVELKRESSNESMYDNPQPNEQPTATDTAQPRHVIGIERQGGHKVAGSFVVDTARKYVVEWDTRDVLHWVGELEDGRYKHYVQQLSTGFRKEQVNGRNIEQLNGQDLRNYGIHLLSDRKQILKHIQELTNSEMYQPQLEGQKDA
eukprot:234957_1